MATQYLALLCLIALFLSSQSTLIDQTLSLDGSKDIGATFTFSIDGESETFTLTMIGPENLWMGVLLGKQDMYDAPAFVYYLDQDNGDRFVLAERYFQDLNAGELIQIIEENNYNVTTIDGTTFLSYTRSWIGDYPTSFTLTQNMSFIEYGFARGTSDVLGYHTQDFRSHSFRSLLHLCCNCNDTNCDSDPQCQELVCDNNLGFDNRCCRNEWREECTAFALQTCAATAPVDILSPCCACLQVSGRGNNAIIGCIDIRCENIICPIDSFCCGGEDGESGSWDNICVNQALSVCRDEPLPKCCGCTQGFNNPNQGVIGCDANDNGECQQGICSVDPFCCGAQGQNGRPGFWDNECAQQATQICNGNAELPFPQPDNSNTLDPNDINIVNNE